MIKYKSSLTLILSFLIISFSACATSSHLTSEQQLNLDRLNIVTAIDNAIDGIASAHDATWLDDNDVILVLKIFQVILDTIRTASDPKVIVNNAIMNIKIQLSPSSLEKWNPYLDSLLTVIRIL
jgi:hypothetical protein